MLPKSGNGKKIKSRRVCGYKKDFPSVSFDFGRQEEGKQRLFFISECMLSYPGIALWLSYEKTFCRFQKVYKKFTKKFC